eukprot:2773018-Pyramimonas_sp.AAC.1
MTATVRQPQTDVGGPAMTRRGSPFQSRRDGRHESPMRGEGVDHSGRAVVEPGEPFSFAPKYVHDQGTPELTAEIFKQRVQH